jgi:hypothetical protein
MGLFHWNWALGMSNRDIWHVHRLISAQLLGFGLGLALKLWNLACVQVGRESINISLGSPLGLDTAFVNWSIWHVQWLAWNPLAKSCDISVDRAWFGPCTCQTVTFRMCTCWPQKNYWSNIWTYLLASQCVWALHLSNFDNWHWRVHRMT